MTLDWDWDDIKVSNKTIIPEGDYDMLITNVEEKEPKKGGKMWTIAFQVNKGPFLGDVIYSNFCVENANLETQKWARSDIKCISSQNGKEKIDNYSELIGMVCTIRVKVEDTENYGEQNTVRILRKKSDKSSKNIELDNRATPATFINDEIPF